MTAATVLSLGLPLAITLVLAWPIARLLAAVWAGGPTPLTPMVGWLERALLRAVGPRAEGEMSWARYASAFVVFTGASAILTQLLMRAQHWLPLNPAGLPAPDVDLAFNTAWSFATNTNWQAYSGEAALTPLAQMVGLGTLNVVSAAAGLAVLGAVIRGLAPGMRDGLGNFWADLVLVTLHVILPLAIPVALLLSQQGVPQTLGDNLAVTAPLNGGEAATVPVGPVASQVAVKQLGSNGGGYYGTNSAHPLENPTPLTNLLELVAILLIPVAVPLAFGRVIGDRRQGRALALAMGVIFGLALLGTAWSEMQTAPVLQEAGVASTGGNLEGKEVRHGLAASALWAVATTATSNGSVNAMHDSMTPLGGGIPMLLMQLGEVVFGGVGSGLYGMLLLVVIAVFVAGLMVGRTPEYLGKKIGAYEMRMAMVGVIVPSLVVLLGTALAISLDVGRSAMLNSGAHGFSEVLYALSSAANNNGSAFAGLGVDSPFYNILLGLAMAIGRFGVAIPALALAGALAAKPTVPPGAGTLPTHGMLFVLLLVGTVLVVGALTFAPAQVLGPVVEHFQMWGRS